MNVNTNCYRAYGYVRLSKEDGMAQESNSVASQKLIIQEFVEKYPEIQFLGIKCDDGYSGVDFNRPAFQELIDEINNGECNCIIINDLSRLGRNYIGLGRYLEDIFMEIGVRVISILDQYDSLTQQNSDGMKIPFINIVNEIYAADNSLKVRQLLDSRRKKGEFLAAFAPYGYRKAKENKNQLLVDEHAAEVVRRIFQWRLEGRSQSEIAKQLNQEGEPSPAEHKRRQGHNYKNNFQTHAVATWSAQAVGRILSNEVYLGLLEQKKESTPNYKMRKRMNVPKEQRIRVENTHEPIIDKETFEAVAELLAKNDSYRGKKKNTNHLFSGVMVCRNCESKMSYQAVRSGGTLYGYYYCRNCHGTVHNRIREDLLAQRVLPKIQKFLSSCISEFEKEKEKLKNEICECQKSIAASQEKLKTYKQKKRLLYEQYCDGSVNQDEYLINQEILDEQCLAVQKSISEAEKVIEICSAQEQRHRVFLQYRYTSELSRQMIVDLIGEIKIFGIADIEIQFRKC